MDIPITLGCQKCGSDDIAMPSRLKDAILTCNSCHAILGKWGDIQAAALTELKRLVKEDLKNYFGGMTGTPPTGLLVKIEQTSFLAVLTMWG